VSRTVSTGAISQSDLLERGIRCGIIGFILLLDGVFVDLEGIVGDVGGV
jgi:hypothetical protein